MTVKKAITVLVGLIALVLVGTVVVLSTVVQYFGVDKRDVIQDYEMALVERLARAAQGLPGAGKVQTPLVGDRADPIADDASLQGRESTAQAVNDVHVTPGDDLNDGSVNDFLDRLQERGWIAGSSPPASSADPSALVAVAADSQGTVAGSATAGNDSIPQPRIPKLIHATWKTDVLPERWEKVRQGCIELHPDYEFKLWSDAASRAFIAEHYPWFLPTFDGYTYPIQRADVIRYFVLHHYGGVYMDLDIGCRRNLDPLLYFRVILPQTIPVGVSNDLMFAEKGHPFMDLVIHNLITFDHTYGTNYPTVMFSTGPMFLSAVYGMWPKDTPEGVERQVRILPRRWYGKNAPPTDMEDSYFDHFYGSSWHADDAGFITFLGKFGIALMYAGVAVVILGAIRIFWTKRTPFKTSPRQIGPIALPYEALPFARSGGPPGSRPGTPSGARSTPQAPRAGDNKAGSLFYMPVWLYPGDRTPGRSPGDAQGAWTQYFSNLSFVDDGNGGHRYEPLPNFSRPPSPSNNSILHAPGAMHDGAFDGVHLHSMRSGANLAPSASGPTPEPTLTSPTSPNPPAYSALRTWGTSLFRGFPFPSPGSFPEPLLPVAHGSGDAATTSAAERSRATTPTPRRRASADLVDSHDGSRGLEAGSDRVGLGGGGSGGLPAFSKHHEAGRFHLSLPRARSASPSPPGYSSVVVVPSSDGGEHRHHRGELPYEAEAVVDARGGPARAGGVVGVVPGDVGASAPATAAPAGDRAVERAPGSGESDAARRRRAEPAAAGPVGGFASADSRLVHDIDAALAESEAAASSTYARLSRRSSLEGVTGPRAASPSSAGVEAEVDRLLSEMTPDSTSSPSSPHPE